jgi:hypothetical protein
MVFGRGQGPAQARNLVAIGHSRGQPIRTRVHTRVSARPCAVSSHGQRRSLAPRRFGTPVIRLSPASLLWGRRTRRRRCAGLVAVAACARGYGIRTGRGQATRLIGLPDLLEFVESQVGPQPGLEQHLDSLTTAVSSERLMLTDPWTAGHRASRNSSRGRSRSSPSQWVILPGPLPSVRAPGPRDASAAARRPDRA